MPEDLWGLSCCKGRGGKKENRPKISVPSVPVYYPVHQYTWYTFFQSTHFSYVLYATLI